MANIIHQLPQYVRHKSGRGPVYEVSLDKGSQYAAREVGA